MDQLSRAEKRMNTAEGKLTDRNITYSLELNGKFYIVENVPARVNEETGEQYFAPETVEHFRKRIKGNASPKKTVKTPVIDYSD